MDVFWGFMGSNSTNKHNTVIKAKQFRKIDKIQCKPSPSNLKLDFFLTHEMVQSNNQGSSTNVVSFGLILLDAVHTSHLSLSTTTMLQ